ncbi:alpha/beta fold hydrolase [Mesorhizobium sp. M2D.F.Ca.ET.185.01.1.1]|uniref:alpha/beta hydrolase n=1 Tax=unclassified Mesorhizobium TaxID=325217 RepID=UPI000FC99DCA|nr:MULTISPECIES: alpha/beta hydrolase [unclassified Mesorhizobium]TGP80700.1 alpha/beta fold hydrolase [bacterium M00.F.Ca.ET.227.01.1.1]TGP90483.1 alpha/beta fold hydrolase [bacterium M00.F.Ca.ET.221.01.1.1]TGP97163.1 alpha/beta fold hydrolase [bacterium M00.F.Ca.ET.222.01.1.1]TGT75695.1 alpha/beta fold hydrolase [bacterium M00.F.Ca.ET.159.01.1.1]TGT84758.1 alpha/beta fold hydrolase [bacterium M00.F.Ca.ET.157.01.1.1]TGU12235.1 alpha/beta fold hydrolase [bacterium M00.F.Ca.ET.163.01.1.1]TGU2
MILRVRIVLGIALALAVSGCAGQSAHDLLNRKPVTAPASDIAAKHEIFVATTRQKATKDPRQVFDGDRSLTTSYALVDVTVPKIHQVGAIERAKGSADSNPAKQFTATDVVQYGDAQQFAKAVGSNIAINGDRALVFVHGFNNGFDDGVFRLTQIAHDTKYPGTPVLFSWASSGKTTGYIYDKDSANAARDDLEATLRMLAKTRVKSIDIIAHSMGTWLTMEALRQLAITGDRDLGGKLGYVVLASPDIDVDVFKKQMIRYGKPDKPFAILLSGDDRALKLSSFISGDKPRVGDYGNAADLASYGVVVVDLTKTKGGDGGLNHAKFADNPILVQLLGDRLRTPAALRAGEPQGAGLDNIGQGLGKAVGSVAEVVITTPFKVLTIATGGE